LIPTNSLIDSAWVGYAQQTISDHGSLYRYYLHTSSDPIEIGGGPYGRQTINPLEIPRNEEDFLVASLDRLDTLIDLDFQRVATSSAASVRYFIDSSFEIDGNPLGITTTNGGPAQRWFEILLDGSRLPDSAYRRYAAIHEFGHTLGLEHPFDDADGDSTGGSNPWTSTIYPEDTVMAYRNPRTGSWPEWFSGGDLRALIETWGLEDDQRGSYQLVRSSTGQPLMIGDPTTTSLAIQSGKVVIEGFRASQRDVFGSSFDDELIGVVPQAGGWADEWFYAGEGNDLISAGGGRDQLLGGTGDDSLRGGHGQDVLEGGTGNDHLYGGGGRNTVIPGPGRDEIFILSDHVSHGDPAGREHGGALADVLLGVDQDDRITILGCSSADLNVTTLDEGLGINAKGVLEAIVLDSNLSYAELTSIVVGDPTRWF